MTHPSLTSALTDAVDALHGSTFPATLVRLIQQQVPFDCALLLGVGQRPVYLYDNLSHQRALLFDRYLAGDFGQDPFMLALANGLEAGVWTQAEVGPLDPDYQRRFYQATGWQEEVGLILPIRAGLTLVLFLGRLGKRRPLSPSERARLEELFPLIHSLCRQHWLRAQPVSAARPLLAESGAAGLEGTDLKERVAQAMASVGGDLLTRRERQVAGLLLQGLDTEAIATALGIGGGTVKNHRKHLYGKLRVGSQAELFGCFLNHLITAPTGGIAPDELSPTP
ncbi:helix-turn-helix transcriptional regulator [Aeromonas eucrenophila]|uniref:LuxR C-terminal-related transcriptional regulator n=1 Tax=Aeromonas eucrenophila TaxID=649 RepID=A0ABW0YBD4_9GAMM|nr:LuxR C-terminal-related transcriptional regulator [Aeromonas eucrenophila]